MLKAIKSFLGLDTLNYKGYLTSSRQVAEMLLYCPDEEIRFKDPLLADYLNELRQYTRGAVEVELRAKNAKGSELEDNPMLWRYVDENGIHSGRVKRILDYKAKNIVRGKLMARGMTPSEWQGLSIYLTQIEYDLEKVLQYNSMRSA